MAVPRNSLQGFLACAKGALRAAISSDRKITLVIGNESADLDSMTCAVLYAYMRSMSPPSNAFTSLYIPITNIPASEIQLRPEFLAVFEHAKIKSENLLTLDDLPSLSVIQSKLRPENTRWILVDHNVLQGQLGKFYSSRVGGVIDHHDDEGKIPKETDNEPRIIEKSGSCTSLIINYCQPAWDKLDGSALTMEAARARAQADSLIDDNDDDDDYAVIKRWDASAAQLGLASILVDTANLKDESKTTVHDVKAVEYLEAKIMACPQVSTTYSRSKFYEEIDRAKKDIAALELRDILRKDYKQWDQGGQKLGVSSVVRCIDFLQAKAGSEANTQSLSNAFLSALEKFAKERELDMYSIMTTSTSSDGSFQRELLLWAFNDDAVAAAMAFEANSRDELGLEDWDGSGDVARETHRNGQWRRVWWQRKVQHSRKRVGPLLRESMSLEESRL